MHRFACLLLTVAWVFLATPAWSLPFDFSTGLSDGRMAAASRPENLGLSKIEIEAGDDFITTSQTRITSASFWGLLVGTGNISQVAVEIYRVFPKDSNDPPDGRVPTRVNSPSDVALATRDSTVLGQLTFTTASLGAFVAANSVLTGSTPNRTRRQMAKGPSRAPKSDLM